MTLSIADRLFETTTTTGSGPFTLAGAVSGFQAFSTLGTGKKTTYYIDDGDSSGVVQKWMDVVGTVTVAGSVTTLSVDQVLASSAGGTTPASFGAGTKNVRGGIGAKVLAITDENLNFVRNYGTDGGSANAHAVTLPYTPLAYSDGMEIVYRVATLNTTAGVTVNVSGLGAKAIKVNGSDPGIGVLPVGTLIQATYRASNNTFEVTNLMLNNLTGPVNFAKGADIASAATTDIGAATGNLVNVTGTTTITALGTVQAGTMREVVFTGALTLTHNATSLSLPGSANITTAANDRATFYSNGSGNWICTKYQRADGTAIAGGLSVTSNYLYVRDEKTSGTAGGSSIAGTQTRTLNTVKSNTITGASVSSNQITLPAGTYQERGSAPHSVAGDSKLRLYNVTDSTYVLEGPPSYSGVGTASVIQGANATLNGSFTIASSKVFELRHYTSSANATSGLGRPISQGTEIYAELEIWKVA